MYKIQEIINQESEVLSISFGPVTHTQTEMNSADNDLGLPNLRFIVNIAKKSQIYE